MKKIFLLFTLFILVVVLSGCTLPGLTTGTKNPAGVFKSYDYGENWQASNLIRQEKKKKITIDKVSVNKIKIDPQDHKQLYMASTANGLWYSDNAGGNWKNIFSKGNVLDFVLDPKNSGVVYITLGRNVYKTLDLGENWQQIYLETRENIWASRLAIDPLNNLLVYLGTTNGEVYKTLDGGESWELIFSPVEQGIRRDKIEKILVNPKNGSIIYVATTKKGIFKSSDGGANWKNLINNYYDHSDRDLKKKFRGVEIFYDLIFDLTQADALVYASSYGLLKSNDGGQTWQTLELLTPPKSAIITSLAINPQDNQQIYYGTSQALYRSFDGGQTWLTSSLPASHILNSLVVDFATPNVVYMGMKKVKKKGLIGIK